MVENTETAGTALSNEPIQPLPPPPALDPRKLALGKQLFHDPRLSRDQKTACATCHNLKLGGADGKPRSLRPGGMATPVNTPSIFNAMLNFRLFWDGRAGSLAEHIQGPMEDTGTDWEVALQRLRQDASYVSAFSAAYSDGLTVAAVQDALVTFERSLVTPNGRFDRYLRGDQNAITAEEKEGYRLFKAYGCTACHQGVNAGGNMYQKVGVMGDYFDKRGDLTPADLGRFNVTGLERDRHMFRVPGLRNVALTAPYLHDGRIKTLEDAVKGMSKFMLGRPIEPREVKLIVQFLHTLNGEYDGQPL
ncbi:cytochrome B6 [Sulfuricaulis limicola]|uniref:Cytochrome B6 n=1 Tax=Sulfuricaulis limicola TaxID=1620215 RepID=A0A1B4XEN6_9GAMM|nr:cytochrome c peroxidase [Sulfuricaulis limicola]BAV33263.1 cytochrome B6 [Sulfuricaulis limicola]